MARLERPAQVGNTIFEIGVDDQLVVKRAQREYEYQHTPEKEAERMARVGEFRKALGVCPKCGVNRLVAPCPNGHMAAAMGQCPMVGSGALERTTKP